MTTRIVTCEYCGVRGEVGGDEGILFIPDFSRKDERFPTCKVCQRSLAAEGRVPCPARHGHHIGSTCSVCGLED